MNMICELEILGLPKTINAIGRKHWSIKAKEAKLWRHRVHAQCILNRVPKLLLKKAYLELERHSTKEPDFDNLVGSFKHVIDGLIQAEVIINDTPSVVGSPVFKWIKASRLESKIVVRVFEAPESPVFSGSDA